MQYSQLISDYKKIIDSSVFSPKILSLGKFSSATEKCNDGTEHTIITVFASVRCSFNQPTDLMDITTANIMFSMFDLLLEANGKLHGDSFRQRCRSLNVTASSNKNEIIQEFVYRVLKQIRNCVVHNTSSITLAGNVISSCYTNPKTSTTYRIEISKNSLEKILQLAYLLSFGMVGELQRLPDIYVAGVLASIYDELVNAIILIDDIDHTPYPLIVPVRIAASQREQHIETKYEVLGNIYIKTEKVNHVHAQRYPIDYVFIYDGKEYIVPFEALDADNKILISELNNWAAKK